MFPAFNWAYSCAYILISRAVLWGVLVAEDLVEEFVSCLSMIALSNPEHLLSACLKKQAEDFLI